MTPLRLDENNFVDLPEKDQHLALFRAVEKLTAKVEDLCGAKKSFKMLAIKWGAISGGGVSLVLIMLLFPNSVPGKLAGAILKAWLGG